MSKKDEILESGVVHFRLGEDFGIRITEIAQEHIMYNYDIRKGIDAIMGSFPGMELPMALKIIKGDYVIEVAENGEEIIVNTERNSSHSRYPIFNIEDWIRRKYDEIRDIGRDLRTPLRVETSKLRYNTDFFIEIPIHSMKALFAGTLDANDALQYLLEDKTVSRLNDLFHIVKNYSETSLKVHETIIALFALYSKDIDESTKTILSIHQRKALEILAETNKLVSNVKNLDFSYFDDEDNELLSYIESAKEIEETLSKGIEPVNILDNYSAGWLAPDGTYYGLNGEIANMLHNQIADALQEKGIVPNEANEVGLKVNPDQWLEEHGWVKIHDNNIQFSGCNNYRTGKRNVDITDKQIEAIHNYIENCHACQIKLGWRLERLSLGMFMMACQNKEQMYKKYFEF